jgi:xylose isomerase
VNASTEFFGATAPVAYGGPEANRPLAFRWYDKDRIVGGRRLEDHLRFAVCYWHAFCWPGSDPFGGETFLRPWHHGDDPMALARAKADIAFELFRLLDVPFFTFHDVDAAPEGSSLAESVGNLNAIADLFEEKMASSKVRLLWGTANLFTHRRYMAGAATNPDPEFSSMPPGRSEQRLRRRIGWAARTTCSGADARVTRPCSILT